MRANDNNRTNFPISIIRIISTIGIFVSFIPSGSEVKESFLVVPIEVLPPSVSEELQNEDPPKRERRRDIPFVFKEIIKSRN
mgnify:CR=1 FL=1